MNPFRYAFLGISFALLVTANSSCVGCGEPVDCTSVCEKALECEVTFDAPDDPDEEQIESGERSELESCVMGCNQSELVTSESAQCIDSIDSENPAICQEMTLDCLEIESTEPI